MTAKDLIKFAGLMVAAIIASIYANQILWPALAGSQLACDCNGPKKEDAVPIKQIVIEENTALKDAIEEVSKTVVLVKSKTAAGNVIEGAGLVLSSDGIIIASSDLLPQGGKFEVIINGQSVPFEVAKRDAKLGLALIKAQAGNLSTSSFFQTENLRLGERIFLLGMASGGIEFVNEGIIKSLGDNFTTTIIEKTAVKGVPVFGIQGGIIGLSYANKSGEVSVLPITRIKEFSGL